MVTGGSHVVPTIGGTKKRIRPRSNRSTRSNRYIEGSLRDCCLESAWTRSAASAPCAVVARHRPNRILIQRCREVIRLMADVANLQRDIGGNRPLNLQSPLLNRWRMHVRV